LAVAARASLPVEDIVEESRAAGSALFAVPAGGVGGGRKRRTEAKAIYYARIEADEGSVENRWTEGRISAGRPAEIKTELPPAEIKTELAHHKREVTFPPVSKDETIFHRRTRE
jgi:hypothetical protein